MNVQERISDLAVALKVLRDHPMCVRLTDDGARFLMIVPPGFSIDAIRVNHTKMGKARAAETMTACAEKYWRLPG